MYRKIALFIILFISFNNLVQAQKTLFLDELGNEIDSLFFNEKCMQAMFYCERFKADSTYLNLILFKYEFGKIPLVETQQLMSLLSQSSNKRLDNQTVIIRILDTLYGYDEELKRIKAYIPEEIREKSSNSTYIMSKSSFKYQVNSFEKRGIRIQKQFFKKYNTETFTLYSFDKGFLKDFPNHKRYKDRGLFKKLFSTIDGPANYVVLKPDGEFFQVNFKDFLISQLEPFLKSSDWTKLKIDYKMTYKSNSFNGFGYFKLDSNY